MMDITRLRDLVRWMLRPPNAAPRNEPRCDEHTAPETPEEFREKISQHDREMATIAEIVAAVRQERPPTSASR